MANFVNLHEALAELERRHIGGTHFGVAVDGSAMSDRAVATAARFMDSKRADHLSVIHVSDKTKTERLPKNLLPHHLKVHYSDLTETARVPMEWICREKEEGQSTCLALTKLSAKHKVQLLVLGSFGRKGEKLEMLGSVSDYSLRESHASICIVRSTSNRFEKQARTLFCTDGSHAAALAFCVLIKLLKKPMDLINVVMISTSDGTKEKATIDHYSEFMREKQVAGEASVRCTTKAVYEGILDAASEMDADVLVMGISGYGQKKLGSVSERISINASCTTIIIKDSYEILKHRYGTAGAAAMSRDITPSGRKLD